VVTRLLSCTQALPNMASTTSGTCCPPTALPYLAAEYTAAGEIVATGGVELYAAPSPASSETAVILLPDVWGWNGGRIRAVADALAAEGHVVVVPKLLAPPFEGGTDGDAMSPSSKFSLDWIKGFPWSTQKAKVDAALAYVRDKGAKKIALMGFCYGGHPACWASAENADVVAITVFHPSIQLEGVFGGDMQALIKSVQCPVFLAPAGDDLPMYTPETSDAAKALKASGKGSECVIKPFKDMTHGFSLRGDLSDAKVARDVKQVMEDAKAFIAKYL